MTSDTASVLQAGGLVPVSATIPADVPTDTVDAVRFVHPALGERVVVRLIPDAIAEGVETEMGLLGFLLQGKDDDIARMKRRSPGFPGWALVNDPERARFALDVMKDFKREAKRIASKPGHARDGFQAIADRLGRSVPHFLPSFWEEVGRAFADAGNLSFAASAFDKARTAEREHGLAVDEEARAEVFLEFALAGALTVKSLQSYAKELERVLGAEKAYDRFYSLAVKRTLGGLAPWASFAKDLRGLAKAAKRKQDAEDERVLEDVLDGSGVVRAPADFWRTYEPALGRLASRVPRVKGRLLDLFPKPASGGDEFEVEWLDLLDGLGVIEGLAMGDPAFAPSGGTAAWFAKAVAYLEDAKPRLLPLLRRLSKRLIAEGHPVRLCDADGWWPQIDVDLLDLCLELGVPVANPPEDGTFDLDDWAKGETGDDGEVHPRDPVFVAKDERFRAMLDKAVDAAVGDEDFERQARGKAALVAARRRWLQERIAAIDRDGVLALVEAVDTLAEKTTAATFAEFPDLYPALVARDPSAALRTTLATAIPDELAWPAYEEAVAELKAGMKKGEELAVTGAFPWLFVSDGTRKVVVIGPTADGRIDRVLEHDLRLPKNASPRGLSYVDGQLLVVTSGWMQGEWKTTAYWSGAPKQPFDLEEVDSRLQGPDRVSIALPGGGATEGGRVVRAGDTTSPDVAHLFGDGDGVWVVDDDDAVRKLDPRDGKKSAAPLPAFFDGWADAARPLQPGFCQLHPVPAAAHATSPLGVRDGLAGWRVRGPDDGPKDVEGIDGRRFGALGGEVCAMLVTWPGDPAPVPVDTYYVSWRTSGLRLWTRDGRCAVAQMDETYAAKLLPAPPREWWHFLVPRDEAGSRALRAITTEQAARLLAGEDVRAVLPAVTDPGLAEGVAKVVAVAKEAAEGLAKVIRADDPAAADVVRSPPSEAGDDVADDEVFGVLRVVLPRQWSASENLTASIRTSSAFFDGDPETDVVDSDIRWFELLGRERGLAFLAVAPGVEDEGRSALLRVLEHLAASRFAHRLDDLRVVDLVFDDRKGDFLVLDDDDDDDDDPSVADTFTSWDGDHRWAVRTLVGYADPVSVVALEKAGADGFLTPAGAHVKKERRFGAPAGREWLRRFVAEARARGPIPVDDAVLDGVSARTGLTRPEAALLWAGLPNLMTWGNDFLGKPLREKLGLKVAEAKTARDALRGTPPDARLALFAATVPDDPAALWTPLGAGPDDETSPVGRFSAAYVARFGRKPKIPDDLVTEGSRALAIDVPVKDALEMAAAPDGSPWLAPLDVPYTLNLYGNPVPEGDDGGHDDDDDDDVPRFSDDVITTVAVLIPWLSATLPVGDPIRAGLPRLHALALERANDDGFVTRVGGATIEDAALAKVFLDTVGSERFVPAQADEDDEDEEDAAVVGRRGGALLAHRWGHTLYVGLRPGRLDAHAQDVVERFLKLDVAGSAYAFLRRLQGDDMRALVARIADTPLPAGAWEQDPSRSAPDVVAKARKKLGLSEDAAVLYLQLLALHAPTKKATLEWNGWKSARYDAAAAELVGKELVVEAKRARAGREHFLPGGWVERKTKDLPLEEWKLPLYGAGRDEDGDVTFPLGPVLPLEPVHATFAKAWARVEAGDVPRFQKVRS